MFINFSLIHSAMRFTNWPSKYSFNWNAGAVGPRMDLVGMLANSTKRAGLHFGLYHSLFEWFNPLYLQDKENDWKTTKFVDDKTMPELYEIVNKYEPELIWSDGDAEAPDSYWKSREFLSWLYNDSPVKDRVVVNDRWGQGVVCHHGGYYTCSDRYSPGHLVKHKWENAMTLDRQSWGFRRNATANEYLTIAEVISLLASTVSCGGNLLINVGPTADGRIPPIMEERLRELGAWLGTNGQAVYGSKPWTYQNDTQTKDIWYTKDERSVYAFFLKWPAKGQLFIAAPVLSNDASIKLLGASTVQFSRVQPSGVKVQLPALVPGSQIAGFSGWVLQLVGVTN